MGLGCVAVAIAVVVVCVLGGRISRVVVDRAIAVVILAIAGLGDTGAIGVTAVFRCRNACAGQQRKDANRDDHENSHELP